MTMTMIGIMIVKNDNDDEHDINDNTKKNHQKKKKKKLMPQLGRPTEGSVCFAWILLKPSPQ